MKKNNKRNESRPTYHYEREGQLIKCTITRDGKIIGQGWGKVPRDARAAAEMDGER